MTAHYDRALLLYQQSRYDLAEQELRQALADEPGDVRGHALLALCLCNRKDYPAATREAEEAVRQGPDVPFSHYALAFTLYHRDRLQEAETAVEQALELAPWDSDYYALLASIRFDQRCWPAALEAAERGLELDAEHAGCTNLRAMALVKLGRRAEAGAALGDALRREPEDALTHANQGWTLLEQRQPDKALEHFREALRLDADLEWARQGIVEALKARHWLYRQMLRYFLWMGRLSRRAQWGVVLGLLIAQQVLASSAVPPALVPLGTVLFWGLVVFVYLTWTADPLFNLLLRLNRFGRLALSREQIRASNWVGGCLFLALAALGGGILRADWRFVLTGLALGCLVIPITGAFKCRAGRPRAIMVLCTTLLAAFAAGGVGILFFGEHLPRNTWDDALAASRLLMGMFFWGVFGSTWLINLLLAMPPKR
ncbi:MAG TPA: tetratricopeptide repeat protein [Gemmataceae bacterium]